MSVHRCKQSAEITAKADSTVSYKKQNLAHSIIKPILTGGLVTGYRYLVEGERNTKSLLLGAGIAAGSSLASRTLIGFIPKPKNEGLRSVEHMILQPIGTGVMYSGGRMLLDRYKSNLFKDMVVGAGSCVVAGYISTPIDRFF
jgi:hypothetical protein